MANGSIGDVPAATYAEYVDDPFLHLPEAQDASATSSQEKDRLLSGPMIDVYVGESRRHWSLHRNLLCHHSEHLEAEVEGYTDGTGRKDKLELPEHDPAGFELLVKWLYQGKLDDVSDLADANQKYEYAVSCHKLYLLCHRFDMTQLKNVAMDQYRKGLNQAELVPDSDEIDDIYRKSPPGSPFRQLMTRIAARQIMDPGSERDVETYRQCFEDNPDFAVDLVKAIRVGTGGMLFEDPTDPGNECQYHDHEDGPNCHIKGKGKAKQAKKTPPSQLGPTFAKSDPSINSDQQSLPLRPPPKTPRLPPPRQARPQDGISAGPLRRRLTSPASSTVGTSKETAVVTQLPSPDMTRDRERDRARLRRVTPPERQRRQQEQGQINGTEIQESRPAPDELHQSSEDVSHPHQASGEVIAEENDDTQESNRTLQRTPSRRGIWEWARAGTGRLSIIGRLPHPEWKGPATAKALADLSINGTPDISMIPEAQDDFSIPSTTATEPDNKERQDEAAAAKVEGLGISNVTNITSPSFSQTKQSSDELVAASSTASTPATQTLRPEEQTNGEKSTPSAASKDSPPTTPDTPTPQQRKRTTPTDSDNTPTRSATIEDMSHMSKPESINTNTPAKSTSAMTRNMSKSTPSPHRIPKYKIALASNLLSPAMGGTAST